MLTMPNRPGLMKRSGFSTVARRSTEDNVVQPRNIRPGPKIDGYRVVRDGLKGDETIVMVLALGRDLGARAHPGQADDHDGLVALEPVAHHPVSKPYRGVLIPDEAIGANQDKRLVYVVGEDNVVQGVILAPGRTRVRPTITMVSSPLSPSRTTR
jgi:multidrug efflux pump subunit AcrA (membrane-fusion protein)